MRAHTILKSTYAEKVEINKSDDGVEVVVTWKYNGGAPGSYRKNFALKDVVGDTSGLGEAAWEIKKRPCMCAREVISGVLQQRGVT
jgi:hypothetical protein